MKKITSTPAIRTGMDYVVCSAPDQYKENLFMEHGTTSLHYLIEHGKTDKLITAIEEDESQLRWVDSHNDTLLHAAVKADQAVSCNRRDILAFLLDKVDIHLRNKDGDTAIDLLRNNNDPRSIALIAEKYPKWFTDRDHHGWNKMHYYAENGQDHLLEGVLEIPEVRAAINARTRDSSKSLRMTIESESKNARYRMFMATPLNLGIMKGHLSVVKMLIQCGATDRDLQEWPNAAKGYRYRINELLTKKCPKVHQLEMRNILQGRFGNPLKSGVKEIDSYSAKLRNLFFDR